MLFEEREEDFGFYVEPKRAEFSASKGGASRHLMVNGTAQRLAVKVKCSNNLLYRIFPVYTCLDPGRAKRLQVVRDAGEARIDKLVLLYKPTACKSARDAFHIQSDSGIGNDENEVENGQEQLQKTLIALVARGASQPPTQPPSPPGEIADKYVALGENKESIENAKTE